MTPEERLRRLRAANQLLHRPVSARHPAEIARATAGIQAQDSYAARLSFRSRSRRLRAEDVDRARSEERSLLRTWVMRMTIHLIPTEDAGWMLPLFEPRMERWSRRRLEQMGMPASEQERALKLTTRMLDHEGPLTRPEVTARLVESGLEIDSQRRHHVTALAINSGIALLGPDRGGTSAMVPRRDWIGEVQPVDREQALAELARRYLGAFGPATDRDMAAWSGLGLREVRAGLNGIAGELREHRVDGEHLLSLGPLPRLPRAGQVRLLGAFDTYLLGYKGRDLAVPAKWLEAINERGGGMIRPAIVRDGLVIGTWSSRRPAGSLQIGLDPFARLDPGTRAAVEAEIEDIGRFEGVEPSLR